MATLEECQAALADLTERMQSSDDKPALSDRTLSCHVPDLAVTFHGELRGGQLVDITTAESSTRAQIRLIASSDDLVALVDGTLDLGRAWLTKRVKIEASMMDMIKLKTMF